jgi:hypothetical protein
MRCPVVVDFPESTCPITTLAASATIPREVSPERKAGMIHVDMRLFFTHRKRITEEIKV